ncbi:MAG TPA: hypothetical protein VII12_00735 [Thermoanaerobaculia bacterium]
MVRTICVLAALLTTPARAATDLYLVAAGQLRSASGRDFRTTVWITNFSSRPAAVQATFLERHPLKSPPSPVTISVGPAETKEITDLPVQLKRQGVVGAIRFQSEEPIAVAARIFSGPPTLGETTGAALRAVTYDAGLEKGDEAFIPGVIYDRDRNFRQTTYLVETGGRPAGIFVRLREASGRELAHDSFLLEPYEQRSLPIAELARGAFVHSGSISVRVTGGGGRVYAVGLQIPTRSGDGYFVDMTVLRSTRQPALSAAEIVVYSFAALAVIAAVALELYKRKS